jgi:hypothetical protein
MRHDLSKCVVVAFEMLRLMKPGDRWIGYLP